MNDRELRKQAWDFFQMQSGQRLATFNFYVVISSLLCTGLAASFKAESNNPYLGVSFGCLLALFSMAFWKIDHRNKTLIRGAEDTLKFFEKSSPFHLGSGIPHLAIRFLREEFETEEKRASRTWNVWSNGYSYSECFGFIFSVFSLVGLGGAVWSALRIADLCI